MRACGVELFTITISRPSCCIMAHHKLALSALLVASISTAEAFSPAAVASIRGNALQMVATTPADLGIDVNQKQNNQPSGGNGDELGGMMDLTGIVFSVSAFGVWFRNDQCMYSNRKVLLMTKLYYFYSYCNHFRRD
jgi:hypothetical protein